MFDQNGQLLTNGVNDPPAIGEGVIGAFGQILVALVALAVPQPAAAPPDGQTDASFGVEAAEAEAVVVDSAADKGGADGAGEA